MPRKTSIYSKVNFTKLKKEISDIMDYLNSEPVDDNMQDDIDWKINKKGQVTPSPVSSIEKKIETQINTLDTCSKILKEIFEKEGLSEFVKYSIETLTNKLNQIEKYYEDRPISTLSKRYAKYTFSNGNDINYMVASREDRIASRTKVSEKVFKIKPLITELENLKEEIVLKGGYEIPESMLYDEED